MTETHTSTAAAPVLPAGRMLLLGLVALVAGTAAAFWRSQANRIVCHGTLEVPRHGVKVAEPMRITQWLVQPGQTIRSGTPLVLLSAPPPESQQAELTARIASLAAELVQVQAQAELELDRRARELDAEIFQTRLQLAGFLKQQFSSKVENIAWERFLENQELTGSPEGLPTELRPLNFVAGVTPETQMRAMLQQEQALNALEVATTQVELCGQRLAQLESRREKLPEHVFEAQGVPRLQADLQRLEAERAHRAVPAPPVTLRAAAFGTVGLLRTQTGELATPEAALVEILDEDQPFVLVPVATRDLPFYQPGMRLDLTFPGGVERHGVVAELPPQTAGQSGTVEIKILPAGKLWPQPLVGSTVQVSRRR